MNNQLVCIHCGSDEVYEIPHAPEVYQCLECNEFFEDDQFILEEIKKHRRRRQEKLMSDQ